MKTHIGTILAVALVVTAGRLGAGEQGDTRALLVKAMKAMGGEAKLAKLSTVSAKGRLTGSEGGMELAVELDGTWQGMSQYRADMEVNAGGNSFKGVVVVNGDKGWMRKLDMTRDAPEGTAPFMQNIFYACRLPQLLPALTDKAFTLSPLGEVKIGTQDALGVAISHKDRKDVSLFFDKANGLPIKSEIRLTEPRGDKETMLEYHFSDYKDFEGIKLCSKITIKIDGKEFSLELRELKSIARVDDSQFDRP